MPRAVAAAVGFHRSQTYRAPLKAVWNAATQAEHLNCFFTTGAEGNITPDLATVTWRWGKFSAEVEVLSCERHRSFEFRWKAPGQKAGTLVRMEFAREKGCTVVRVHEAGWKASALESAFDHCGGWSEWLCGLKAYVQYGIDLRK